MKKVTIILLVFWAFIIMQSNAQVSVGVKGGLNLSMVTDSTTKGYKGVLNQRFNYGAFINFNLKGNLSIQSELLYSEEGEKEVSGSDYQELNLNYLEIPILAKYTFGKSAMKAFIEGGPYFAYWQSGESKYKIVEYELQGDDNYNFNSINLGNTTLKDNRLDIGLDFGGGTMYELGPGNIVLDARICYGLTSINSYTGEKLPGWRNRKNRVVSISLGYSINLDKQ